MDYPPFLFCDPDFLSCDHWDSLWYLHNIFPQTEVGDIFLNYIYEKCRHIYIYMYMYFNNPKFQGLWRSSENIRRPNRLWIRPEWQPEMYFPSTLSRSCSLSPALSWGGDRPQKLPEWANTSIWLRRNVTAISQTGKLGSYHNLVHAGITRCICPTAPCPLAPFLLSSNHPEIRTISAASFKGSTFIAQPKDSAC